MRDDDFVRVCGGGRAGPIRDEAGYGILITDERFIDEQTSSNKLLLKDRRQLSSHHEISTTTVAHIGNVGVPIASPANTITAIAPPQLLSR